MRRPRVPFPTLPFKIDRDSDGALVKYLKVDGNFPFLKKQTRSKIAKLDDGDLLVQNKPLLQLWPQVLVDALWELKKHDPREWKNQDQKLDYGSFFHEGSLGVTELRDVLESFARFESMLYGASPDRYRDHIAHAFRVWIVGQAILSNDTGFRGRLFSDKLFEGEKEIGSVNPDSKISKTEWQCMWAIVALCHDLGHPLSHVDRINSLARDALRKMGLVPGGDLRFSFSQQMLPFHDTLIRLMASKPIQRDGKYYTHLQNKYYLKLLKSFDNLDHGVVSSLLVSKALVYFLESDLAHDPFDALTKEDVRQFLIRREILRAIAAHTCQDIYHLRFDTLAFLLYVIDEIQCWGRPTLEELQHQAMGMPEASAQVASFEQDRVAVVIRTKKGKWSNDQLTATHNQLSKLHRMLRLGVDTAMLKDRYLEFAFVPDKGEGMHLLLKNGRIAISPVKDMIFDHLKKRNHHKS
jgi:hypothetical protein